MKIDPQKHYVGCDISDKSTAICIVNHDGDIVHERWQSHGNRLYSD